MNTNIKEIILSVKNLSVSYAQSVNMAVKNVSFELERGDFLLIVGENGSGKSTLLKALLGLLPISGSVEFSNSENAKNIGYLSQQSDIIHNFPAKSSEVVLSGFIGKKKFFSFYTRKDKRKANDIIEYLGISHLKNKPFSTLSGGERQRVLLARALVCVTLCDDCHKKSCHCHDETFCHTNGIIVLDEPSNGLDPVANKNLYETLYRLNREKGMTVIMVSHLVESTALYANKILHMGREMKFFGSREDYIKTELYKAFVKSENTTGGEG